MSDGDPTKIELSQRSLKWSDVFSEGDYEGVSRNRLVGWLNEIEDAVMYLRLNPRNPITFSRVLLALTKTGRDMEVVVWGKSELATFNDPVIIDLCDQE